MFFYFLVMFFFAKKSHFQPWQLWRRSFNIANILISISCIQKKKGWQVTRRVAWLSNCKWNRASCYQKEMIKITNIEGLISTGFKYWWRKLLHKSHIFLIFPSISPWNNRRWGVLWPAKWRCQTPVQFGKASIN